MWYHEEEDIIVPCKLQMYTYIIRKVINFILLPCFFLVSSSHSRRKGRSPTIQINLMNLNKMKSLNLNQNLLMMMKKMKMWKRRMNWNYLRKMTNQTYAFFFFTATIVFKYANCFPSSSSFSRLLSNDVRESRCTYFLFPVHSYVQWPISKHFWHRTASADGFGLLPRIPRLPTGIFNKYLGVRLAYIRWTPTKPMGPIWLWRRSLRVSLLGFLGTLGC